MELVLERPSSDSGFGFSVSWLRPPRIERVEVGKPASVAGLMIGDRILGVGGTLMGENVDIYHGIKGAGLRLKLTIERQRTTPWNKIHVRQELLTSLSDSQKRLFSAQLRFFKQTVSALDRYLIPAGKTGLMTQQEMKVIFGGVIGIITVMARLLHCVNRGDCGLEDANLDHLPELNKAYSEYTTGLPTSATTLSAKMADQKFTQFILSTQTPYDLTYILFSPLYHLRQTLQLTTSSSVTNATAAALTSLHAQLLQMYTKLTMEHCILEPTPSPLVTVQELESRLVSPTAAKPVKLTRWLFGSRLELRDGSSWSPVFGFLFSDLLLIVTQPTRDRLFFVKQQVWLKELASLHFSSGGDLDFKLVYAQVKRFRLLRSEKAVHLRVAGTGMKAMWKLLLQKQIIELNTVGFPSSSSAFSLSEFTEKFPDGGGGGTGGGTKRTVSAPETIHEQEEASDDVMNNNQQQEEVKIYVEKPHEPTPAPRPVPATSSVLTTPPVKPVRVAKEAKAKAKELKELKETSPKQPPPEPEPSKQSKAQNTQMQVPKPNQTPTPAPRVKGEQSKTELAQQQTQAPIPAPRTIITSSSTTNNVAAAAAQSQQPKPQPQKQPIPRPRSYQDSPAPQHRTYCQYDPRVQRDYPELFGITPRDRRMFIKAIGDRGICGSVSAGATPAMAVRTPFAHIAMETYSKSHAVPAAVVSAVSRPSTATTTHDIDEDLEFGLGLGFGMQSASTSAPKVDHSFMKLRSAQLRAALAPQNPQHLPQQQQQHIPTSPELSSNDSGISDETAEHQQQQQQQNHVEVRHLPLESMTLAPPHVHHHFHHDSRHHNNQQHTFAYPYKGTTTAAAATMQWQCTRQRSSSGGSQQHQQQSSCTSSICSLDCMVDHMNHNHNYGHGSHDQCQISHPQYSIAPQAQQPLLVKIVSPIRMSIVRHHNVNSSSSCTAVLENIESTDGSAEEISGSGSGSGSGSQEEESSRSRSQSDDAASASPAPGGGGGTTEPSWSSEEDLLDKDVHGVPRPVAPVPPLPSHSSSSRTTNSITNFYKLTDLSDSDDDDAGRGGNGEDDDGDDDTETGTLNRYESYERLDRIAQLPRSTACFGLADADKDNEDVQMFGHGFGDLDDRYDFLSDDEVEEEDGYEYPEQVEDNTYSVSRLGPLPPVLEEEFEEDEEAFMQHDDEDYETEFHSNSTTPQQQQQQQQPSPSTSTRSRQSSSYNFTVARIAGLYARTSISPLRILRDLWLRRRLRERR